MKWTYRSEASGFQPFTVVFGEARRFMGSHKLDLSASKMATIRCLTSAAILLTPSLLAGFWKIWTRPEPSEAFAHDDPWSVCVCTCARTQARLHAGFRVYTGGVGCHKKPSTNQKSHVSQEASTPCTKLPAAMRPPSTWTYKVDCMGCSRCSCETMVALNPNRLARFLSLYTSLYV